MRGMETVQYSLPQECIPRAWYNIAADLPTPLAPPLHPGTLQPLGPSDLAPLFPMALIEQEVSTEREIEILHRLRRRALERSCQRDRLLQRREPAVPLLLVHPNPLGHFGVQRLRGREVEGVLAQPHRQPFGKSGLARPRPA